ncbi:MAG TPA: glycosyltransferase [Abditibacteriaceae bacterium]|jgi:GT2 family glycosyltransferase
MISVLITTYNALDYLQLCVESLQRFSTCAPEIVIYADGSRSETHDYLKTLPPEIKWRYEAENVGISRALNRVAEMASGDWLYFVNDDMAFAPGWDEALERHAIHNRVLTGTVVEPPQPNVGIASCHIARDFGLTVEDFNLDEWAREAEKLKESRVEPGINYPFLIEAELFRKIGGIDERFSGPVHDPDVFYRIALAGGEMLRARDSLCYHFSGRTLRFADGKERVSRRWIEDETAGKIAFLDKWGEKQRYSFGGVPHPPRHAPDGKWSPLTRLKLELLKRRYRARAARRLKEMA